MFEIASYLFSKKFFLNLMIILQLSLCISFTNYGFCIKNSFYNGYKDTYNYENATVLSSEMGSAMSILYDMQYKKDFEATGSVVEFNYPSQNISGYEFYRYGINTLKCLENYLEKGKFSKSIKDGVINCLVVGNNSLNGTTIKITYNEKDYQFYVCGVLSSKTKILKDIAISGGNTPGQIFTTYNMEKTNIVCLDSDTEFLYQFATTQNALVFFNENEAEATDIISRIGRLRKMEVFRRNADTNSDYTVVRVFSHISNGVGIISFISMICMFILNIKGNESMFKTFKQLGIRPKHIITISLIYMILFNLILVPISLGLEVVWDLVFKLNITMIKSASNYIFTIGIVLATFALNILFSYYMLFKEGKKDE